MEPLNLSVADAARTLGIGRSKLYELIKKNQLETVNLGARTLVRVESVRAFSNSLTKRAA